LFTGIALTICTADTLPAQKKEAGSAKPSAKEAKATPKKIKGRVPAHYGKLNLSTEQRNKIYKIQADYKSQIDSLKKQLAELNKKRNTEYLTVLSTEQKQTWKSSSLKHPKEEPPKNKIGMPTVVGK